MVRCLVGGEIPPTDTYEVAATLPERPVGALRIEVLTDDALPHGGPGLAENGNFVLSELSLGVAAPGAAGETPVPLVGAVADYSGDGGDVKLAFDGDRDTGWHIYAAQNLNVAHTATFFLQDALPTAANRQLTIVMDQNYKNPRYQIGRFRVSVTAADRDVLALPTAVARSTGHDDRQAHARAARTC